MSTEKFFYGDARADDWVPGDYLKTVMNAFKEKSTDSFKVMKLETRLASGSAAEEWFDSPAVQAVKADWSLVEAQFKLRWPKEARVLQTKEQRRSKLKSEKLLKEEIGVDVMHNGVEMSGQARWASKILALSALADDNTGALISVVRDGMPEVMRKLVKGEFDTWASFCDAVKKVSVDEIDSALTEENRLRSIEDESRSLRTLLARSAQRPPPPSPATPTTRLASSFANFGVARGAPTSPAPAASSKSNTNPFIGGAMGANNIMRGYSPGQGRGVVAFRAASLRHADLSKNTQHMVHHGDTPQGWTAYRAQVAAWKAAWPAKYRGGDEYAPYPLTPGTEAADSGACFDCGVSHPRGGDHPRPLIDEFERHYRRVANRITRDSAIELASASVSMVGGETDLLVIEATAEYPRHFVSRQGNGDGSVV
jgi:hypothetical protein